MTEMRGGRNSHGCAQSGWLGLCDAGLERTRNIRNALHAKHATVAGNFLRWAERFLKIVGQLDRGVALGIVELANQVKGVKRSVGLGAAIAKIVGQKRAPAGAETDAALGSPLAGIEKIGRAAKVRRLGSVAHGPGEMRVQAQEGVHVEGVGSDEALLTRVAAALLEPGDVLVASQVRILAVGALPRPGGDPFRSVAEKLR